MQVWVRPYSLGRSKSQYRQCYYGHRDVFWSNFEEAHCKVVNIQTQADCRYHQWNLLRRFFLIIVVKGRQVSLAGYRRARPELYELTRLGFVNSTCHADRAALSTQTPYSGSASDSESWNHPRAAAGTLWWWVTSGFVLVLQRSSWLQPHCSRQY